MEHQKRRQTFISLLVFFLLIGGTAFYFLKGNDLTALAGSVQRADPIYLIGAGAMLLLFIFLEGLKLYRTVHTFAPVSLGRCIGYGFVGFTFSAITPSSSGGQPAQMWYMHRDGIKVSHSTLSLLIIAMIYLIVNLLFCGVLFLTHITFVTERLSGAGILFGIGAGLNLVALSAVILAISSSKLIDRLGTKLIEFLGRRGIVKNASETVENFRHQISDYGAGARHLRHNPSLLIELGVITLCQLAFQFLITWFIYRAFHLTGYTMIQVLVLQAIMTMSVSSLPIPGAVGISESVFMLIFRSLFGAAMVLPAMLLSRGFSFYLLLLISVLGTVLLHICVKKQTNTVNSKT